MTNTQVSGPIEVVVDMQTDEIRLEKDESLVAAACERLRRARAEGRYIFLVEITNRANPTSSRLVDILTAGGVYDRYQVLYKDIADGSAAVLEACQILELECRQFVVYGLYASCCVFFTALGLLQKGCQVSVDQDASSKEEHAWWKYRSFPGIHLTRSIQTTA